MSHGSRSMLLIVCGVVSERVVAVGGVILVIVVMNPFRSGH
jgi:hypothetical protein